MLPTLDAFYHPAEDGGQRLYLHHGPPAGAAVKGAVVYVHPFAEEMNKSRRMAALTSRNLAALGWAVLQVDLAGCGDSTGELAETSWDDWVGDTLRAATWLQSRNPGVPLWLWGARAGALLATEATSRLSGAPSLLFWQPVLQGKAVLQQFLRLKAASQLADGGGRTIIASARADLHAGRPIDVAGYSIGPTLALGLEGAQLKPPIALGDTRHVIWLEVSNQPEPTLSLAAQEAKLRWQSVGWQVDMCAVGGSSFWQTTEIEDAPALSIATVAALTANRTAPVTPDADLVE